MYIYYFNVYQLYGPSLYILNLGETRSIYIYIYIYIYTNIANLIRYILAGF